jgi:4a-hydroxytetrahydrobiopterin dehydratase
MTTKLTEVELGAHMAQLAGWSLENGKLHKKFQFADFVTAFGFITKVAIVAEKMDHHPELYNVYNRVTIDLTTHDAGGISIKDIELAKQIDSLS